MCMGPLTHKIQLVLAVPFPFCLSCVYSPPFTTIHCGMWTGPGDAETDVKGVSVVFVELC